MATTVAFRALDDAGKLPDNYVNPYYLEDLKRRVFDAPDPILGPIDRATERALVELRESMK